MPDGIHEGSPADSNNGNKASDDAWGLNTNSVGSRRKVSSAASTRTPIKDAKEWAELRVALATSSSFGISHKTEKKPEKSVTDASPKATAEKKLHPFDKFISEWKKGDPIPLVAPGKRLVLHQFGKNSNAKNYGYIKDKDVFVVAGKEYSAKGVLGMTLGDDSRLPNLLLRIARARNIPFDDEGRLRCPEDTPGGGQFTDLQLSNCMIPSARTAAGAVGRAGKRIIKGSIASIGKRDINADGRTILGDEEISARTRLLKDLVDTRRKAAQIGLGSRSLITGRRGLRSSRQMKKAVRSLFPNLDKKSIDDFFEIPLDRFNDANEIADYIKFRWGFMESFLLHALDNRDWAETLGHIGIAEPGELQDFNLAEMSINPDGLATLLIDPSELQNTYNFVTEEDKNWLFAVPPDMRTFGHQTGTHEFGHFADFYGRLKNAGVQVTTSDGKRILDVKNHPVIAPLVAQFDQAPDDASRAAVYNQIEDSMLQIMGLQPKYNDPFLSLIQEIVGSVYGQENHVEGSAEFFAAYMLAYGLLAQADPAIMGFSDRDSLEKFLQDEFAKRFGVKQDANGVPLSLGGPKSTPRRAQKYNRQARRVGQKLSDARDRRSTSRRNNSRNNYKSPRIRSYSSDIKQVSQQRGDGRTGEFYPTKQQTPKQRGPQLNTANLNDGGKDLLVNAADGYLGKLKQIFRQRMNLSSGDDIVIDDILDAMSGFEGTDGKQFGVWYTDLHNMIVLDRLMSSGDLSLINAVKRDGRIRIFESMGITVGAKQESYLEIETKALPRKMRRIGRALAARFDPRAQDGDGDGLVQDSTQFERPSTEVVQPPRPAEPRTRRTFSSTAKKSKISKKEDIVKLTQDIIDQNTDSVQDWTLVKNPKIKQTPSMSADNVRRYVDSIILMVESKYGPVKTVGDVKSILSQIFREVKLTGYGDDGKDLTPEEAVVFAGLISISMNIPDFKQWGFAFRERADGFGGQTAIVESRTDKFDLSSGFDRSTSLGSKWLVMESTTDGSVVRELSGDLMQARIDMSSGRVIPIVIPNEELVMDNVSTQLSKTVYSSGRSGMNKAERRQIHALAQLATLLSVAHHEMGHAVAESLRYDETLNKSTALERDQEIVNQILPKAARYAKQVFVEKLNRQVIPFIVMQANRYEANLPDIENAILDGPARLAKLQVAMNNTRDVSIAKTLQQQITQLATALDNLREERIYGLKIIQLYENITNSNLIYTVAPFEPGHPLHGMDMGRNGKKKTGDEKVVDAILDLLSDPVFMEQIRQTDIYQEVFPNDPIENEQLISVGSLNAYSYGLNGAVFFDPSTDVGKDTFMSVANREMSQSTWDGIKDLNDKRDFLELTKLFSQYGSTRPYYGGVVVDSDDIEPQEIFAELHAVLMSGHGIQDFLISESVKQNIVKWMNWAYRGTSWQNIISPISKEVLGIK